MTASASTVSFNNIQPVYYRVHTRINSDWYRCLDTCTRHNYKAECKDRCDKLYATQMLIYGFKSNEPNEKNSKK